jgi:MFS family permease
MAKTFKTEESEMGLVNTLTQVGYACGILFFTPLGDILPRKPLLITLCIFSSIMLLGIGFSQYKISLEILSFFLGLFDVIAQVIIPFAADLSKPQKRGRTVGIILGGILVGILLARTISGLFASWLGWRSMFWIASFIMFLLGIIFIFIIPSVPPINHIPYFKMLLSILVLIKKEVILRQCTFFQKKKKIIFSDNYWCHDFWMFFYLLDHNHFFIIWPSIFL